MESQQVLWRFDQAIQNTQVKTLRLNNLTLETEKERFFLIACDFIDHLRLDKNKFKAIIGRPKTNLKDVLKSLLVMSYNSISYKRIQSDLKDLVEKGLISKQIPRSTLNDYVNDKKTVRLLECLIIFSALFFKDNEDTLILDSTWLATKMYVGGHKRVHNKKNCNFEETRKIHVACLKNSGVIAYAKATAGEVHDCPVFKEIVKGVVNTGFNITTLLADKGYCSKENYALCEDLGIFDTYISFKSNCSLKRGKSNLWKERLALFRKNPDLFHEKYRFRPIIEGVFSTIKRKNTNYLRSRNIIAQDVELLLKGLVYNFTIIARYS